MRKPKFFLLIPLLFSGFLSAQSFEYLVDVVNFRDAKGTPYIEIQADVDAAGLQWNKNQNGKFQAALHFQFFIQSVQAEQVAQAIQVKLISPELNDTLLGKKNIRLSDVRRISLSPGKYSLFGTVEEPGAIETKKLEFEREFSVRGPEHELFPFSDIQFIESFKPSTKKSVFTKYGLEVVPRLQGDFFEDADSLQFYLELYQLSKLSQSGVYARTFLSQANEVGKFGEKEVVHKKGLQDIEILKGSFDISDLPTNTYYLQIELLSNGKKIAWVARKFFVINSRMSQRIPQAQTSGDFSKYFSLTESEIDEALGPMRFISTQTEADFAKALTTYEEKKNYFLSFWDKRKKENNPSPLRVWLEFKARIDYTSDHYVTNYKKGWQTDRGRVLIIYGLPNDIENNTMDRFRYPHEIWHYNNIGAQNNLIFVFYDNDLVTGEYVLLHSNCLGEVNNSRWEIDLVSRSTQEGNLDETSPRGDQDQQIQSNPRYYKPR